MPTHDAKRPGPGARPSPKTALHAQDNPAAPGVQLVLTIAREEAAEIRKGVIAELVAGDADRRRAAARLLVQAHHLGEAIGRAPKPEFVSLVLTLLEGIECGNAASAAAEAEPAPRWLQ